MTTQLGSIYEPEKYVTFTLGVKKIYIVPRLK